ncbi:MAG: sigma-70 family RNA polymerase sigma factor, partial [Saprospiraceae bacterium]|nr:sigma-70 family RNA polymerase sigma factor [Saprospiraceae bacterium]
LHTLRAYLFTAFRRMLLRRQKTIDTRKNILDQIAVNEPPVQFTIEELSMEQEGATLRQEMIADTLNKLPARQREVVYLKYFNDMSLQEIAEVMSITYQGVANTLYKAFVALRKDAGLLKIRELCLLLAAIVSGL